MADAKRRKREARGEKKASRVDGIGVLKDLVTEYASGRMVTPPAKRVVPECWVEFRDDDWCPDDSPDGVEKGHFLIISPVSEDVWRWHVIRRKTLGRDSNKVEYSRYDVLPETYYFKVSDAPNALRIILCHLREKGHKRAARFHIPMTITENKDVGIDLCVRNVGIDLCDCLTLDGVDLNLSDADDDHFLGIDVDEIKDTFNTIMTILDSKNLSTPILTVGPEAPLPDIFY